MLKFSAELKVNRPVEKVFAWLTNADNQGKFDKSSLKMEERTPGPWRTGSQFRERAVDLTSVAPYLGTAFA
jgi:hypothetical protein